MQHPFSRTENDNKQREPLWTELLPKRLAQMLHYFFVLIRFGWHFTFKEEKEKNRADGRKYVAAKPSGLQQEFGRTFKCTEKPGGSLEPLLIAFNMIQSLSFYRNGSAAFQPALFHTNWDKFSSAVVSGETLPGFYILSSSSLIAKRKYSDHQNMNKNRFYLYRTLT